MTLPNLRLKRHEDRRLRQGHLWVFSNEVDTRATPLKRFEPGEAAVVEDAGGKALGIAYVNPNALICARLLSRDPRASVDRDFWLRRLQQALAWRERLFPRPHYRLVHGEGDWLPGLVIDRFGDVCVAQLNTAGIERHRHDILAALDRLLRPKTLVLRNDSPSRTLEGLATEVEVIGAPVEHVTVEENGCRFLADPVHGQKTGWFFDHRDNRARAARLAKDGRVLDLFVYTGAWGIQLAAAGAKEVVCVDSSAAALALARENARLNGVADRVAFVQADVFEHLKLLKQEKTRFDLVVADPPAFIKRRKDVARGMEGYRRLNKLALARLGEGGILVSCSCSHHLEAARLQQLVSGAAGIARTCALFARGGQAADHPAHPAIPETEYLKAQFYRVIPWP
ncbi:23S rRNA (cytosine1962-C5)-methyltransferase [Methylomarinovum caldicuralii]|uniref:23S rRNA (Cytosine1962-C5)-methyltransferase n=1 Tax=Methylomarinovum caldicuralii TaxID=438856 RepID=A0AAU9CCL4_9GAMM|nr:class I SAM-dependent rRNA methyltransferase [Methylomarinovum caldicuralii]BCX80675.1 23S rRNA (cytosine1962-C5)-methyltransferase [Methylomarinovum caldicuralii]